MTKNKYLDELKLELKGLSQVEINDIIRDQDEYINDAFSSGRTESEVISSLGSTKNLAKELKANRQIQMASTETKIMSKTNHILKAIMSLCFLAPFNLIFVLGPFIGFCGVLFAFWATSATVTCLGVLGIPFSFLFSLAGLPLFTFILFSSLTTAGVGILLLIGSYYISQFFLKMTVSYLKWNVNFIIGDK